MLHGSRKLQAQDFDRPLRTRPAASQGAVERRSADEAELGAECPRDDQVTAGPDAAIE
jgi:hypothetical protein